MTILVCNDQRPSIMEGVCTNPREQKRALFSLWSAYAVDVTTDLAGKLLLCLSAAATDNDTNVSTISHDFRAPDDEGKEAWCVRSSRPRLDMNCTPLSSDRHLFVLTYTTSCLVPCEWSMLGPRIGCQRYQIRSGCS
jgi:hypothetical protein